MLGILIGVGHFVLENGLSDMTNKAIVAATI